MDAETPRQIRNDGEDDVLLLIVGAPPEEGGADYFPDVDESAVRRS